MEDAEKKRRVERETARKNAAKKKLYESTELLMPKGTREKIKEAAKKMGQSKNAYILAAVEEKYLKDTGMPLIDGKSRKGEENNGSGLRP